jgi:uncharacterized protein YbjT (DUF2867 family)
MIVVTAPTGNIGHQVVDGLLDAGEDVRVIVRDPAKLAPRVRDQAEVVAGSHGDPDVVATAFEGADAVFWLAPPDPAATDVEKQFLDFTRPAAETFVSRNVARVVGVSALGRGTPWAESAGLVTVSLHMDDLIAATGVGYRALAMPSFMDNMLRQADAIRGDGVFYLSNDAELKSPTVATRDIASVAVSLLRDDSWGGFEEVPVLGPEDLSLNERAQIMGDVLGRPVRYQRVPGESFKATMLSRGMSESMASAMLEMADAKDKGLDNFVRDADRTATPTTFRQFCEQMLTPR